MWPNSLDIDVSRESQEKLEIYHALLVKWQRAINIVSPKTIDQAWVRHFADSAQVEPFIKRDVSRESPLVFADLGCGGGFAGLVLAIMRPDLKVHLVESDERKCQFMRTVSRETNVDVMVHNSRIEACTDDIRPDIVTARALADLGSLLGYIEPWFVANPDLECVFHKGARADEEVELARDLYAFDLEKYKSKTDSMGCILHLKNISKN